MASENQQIEMLVAAVMKSAGLRGIKVDEARLAHEQLTLAATLITAMQGMQAAGFEGRPSSRKEVAVYLFDVQKLPETGKRSVSKDALRHPPYANHPFISFYHQWNTMNRTLSLIKAMKPFTTNGRVTTQWNTTNDTSARIYCKDFNVQQLPIPGRNALVADEGLSLTLLDYDQQEMRVLAALSQSQNLKAMIDSGDIHRATAAKMLHKRAEDILPAERELGKAFNFGLMYGQEAGGLAMKTGSTREEAEDQISSYFASMPEVARFIARTKAAARATGTVTNPFGHTRAAWDVDPDKADRQAINTLIQGTAASIVKRAIVRVARRQGVRVLASVHDSILTQHKPEISTDELRNLVETELNGVKLTASIATERSWGAAMLALKGDQPLPEDEE